jgi:hypothetical protein
MSVLAKANSNLPETREGWDEPACSTCVGDEKDVPEFNRNPEKEDNDHYASKD